MGESELKAALQHDGDKQIRDVWQHAEAAVATRREAFEAGMAQLRSRSDRALQAEITTLRNDLLFAAQTRAMACRLHAEAALGERLLQLARQLLPELAERDCAALWQALCRELPEADWAFIRVRPADQQRAGRDFPAATVEHDETLGGGLIVTNLDSTIRIDNSLIRRLHRAWPDLLPQLLEELRKQVNKDATTLTDTTG